MIVTVANHKGGVGKTSLVAHIAFRAAGRCRVLAVDMDAQGNLTTTLARPGDAHGRPGADLLFSAETTPRPMASAIPGIDLLPATAALNGTDRLNLSSAFQARTHLRALARDYGLVIIDTAPALGLRLTAALSSSERVLVPLVPEAYAVDGVASLLSEAAAIQENLNPALKPADFVLNLVNRQATQHVGTARKLAQSFRVHTPWLSRRIGVSTALAERRPVWSMRNQGAAAVEWESLCDSLLDDYGLPAARD